MVVLEEYQVLAGKLFVFIHRYYAETLDTKNRNSAETFSEFAAFHTFRLD